MRIDTWIAGTRDGTIGDDALVSTGFTVTVFPDFDLDRRAGAIRLHMKELARRDLGNAKVSVRSNGR